MIHFALYKNVCNFFVSHYIFWINKCMVWCSMMMMMMIVLMMAPCFYPFSIPKILKNTKFLWSTVDAAAATVSAITTTTDRCRLSSRFSSFYLVLFYFYLLLFVQCVFLWFCSKLWKKKFEY